jgi:hypothetical protein
MGRISSGESKLFFSILAMSHLPSQLLQIFKPKCVPSTSYCRSSNGGTLGIGFD